MGEEEWFKEAMTDAMLVAEVLLSLGQTEPSSSPWPSNPEQSAKNSSASPALQLEWSVRQRRSKLLLRKKYEPPRASPTTALSWSGGTSVSGSGGADGSEESSRPPWKPVDNTRSKVWAISRTIPPIRSRRKKTLAELKEEMGSRLKENESLKSELEMVKLKFENLRTANETLSRKLKFEKERAMNESTKRMKLESNRAKGTAMAPVEPKNPISELSQQREAACRLASVGENENENDPCLPNESCRVQDASSCDTYFMLPDLNLPIEDDSGCEVLHEIS